MGKRKSKKTKRRSHKRNISFGGAIRKKAKSTALMKLKKAFLSPNTSGRGLMLLGNVVPKTALVKFKKCGDTTQSDTPNFSTEKSTIIGAVRPSKLDDPLVSFASGTYAKIGAMALLYENAEHVSQWIKIVTRTNMIESYYIFSYPHTSSTARHVQTDGYALMCRIPRIKFKLVKVQQVGAGMRTTIIRRKISQKTLFPKKFFNPNDNISDTSSAPTNEISWHFGIVNVKPDGLLAAIPIEWNIDCGITTRLFRRDEIVNP